MRGCQEYLVEKKFQNCCIIQIFSSEYERGFSQVNLMVTPSRSLLVNTVNTAVHENCWAPSFSV
jgi:hypothetical protein